MANCNTIPALSHSMTVRNSRSSRVHYFFAMVHREPIKKTNRLKLPDNTSVRNPKTRRFSGNPAQEFRAT